MLKVVKPLEMLGDDFRSDLSNVIECQSKILLLWSLLLTFFKNNIKKKECLASPITKIIKVENLLQINIKISLIMKILDQRKIHKKRY